MNVENKLKLSQKTFDTWKSVPFKDKQKLLKKLAKVLDRNAEQFGKLITKEMNKPITQSVAEIKKCALMVRYYADAENILKSEQIKTEFRISEIHYIPKGVILGVMPWNFPFWQAIRFAVPAILAGNTVVMKHASICFGSGNAIEKIFLEAGFPKGVFQNLEIGHAEVKKVLEHPIVKGVSLTGSEKAGAEVAAIAGKNIKKSLLELGGSDAFIVLDDADFASAAEAGAKSRLLNCGQACNAAKRFIIQKNVEKEFLSLFIQEYQKFVAGDPLKKKTNMAGMARPDLADELEQQYNKALKNGAEIILPLQRISENEFVPGLIKVKAGNSILQEELFGPLGMVMIAKDDQQTIKLANNIPFGLSDSVWTKDKKRQQFYIDHLESGTVSINKATSSDPRLPFGGAKSSGYGTELSMVALREFVNVRTVVGK
ncbi:aldehyde dehydrogenase family protein [Kaistella antarctica]|uniref:Aldehyde dehydrogenase n=1 Tax=Kaistella antarctica TaxID=266748 RepID=A0A448NUT3_9FLAO|nr:aldehyde dehydrogenase family protein [Kaistella antarctica]KEY18578.1 aldehyde dehydrogenase [Kaistella antarctica]SEV87187.1 succinate-semialdehyde dehydrogenase / glutarate-semialdehyde dehydrogenase [Kaistella antarctica]VEI01447.1 Succinate semialdehyde dehydrogenase [NAD(P)+] Sad [Kaistella antarctica]